MLYVVGELVLVLGIQSQHVHETLHVYALEVAVGQRLDVAARFDDEVVWSGRRDHCPATAAAVAAVLKVHVYVASDQVALTCAST